MLPDLISLRKGVALLLLATCVDAFSCSLDVGSIHYDISPLSGLRVAEQKDTPTPPTTNDAMVRMDLCSEDGLQKEEGIDDRDQCGSNTKVCLKFINHKASDSNPDRVTAVIPIWPMDVSDDDIRTEALGKNGLDGLSIQVYGPEYAGNQQRLNLTLLCDPDAQDSKPEFSSYSSNQLSLTWATPDACPRTPGEEIPPAPGTSKGMGLWGFIKFMFWLIVFSLALYFGIGIFYNHQQYSAKGWDLIPHRDFWREFPALIQDLFSHVFAGLKGGGGGGSSGRGGYSSLG